ncbi:MAG: outer membrane beta-barrel protein [Chitinophagaceae bacterium]|nr:outer membrane beta-barrel protein [Chitinophagaceae bacterium]
MKLKIPAFLIVLLVSVNGYAQTERYEYVQKGEFGITVGMAHYFGDLNTRAAINRPKPALGAFFRKQFGNYVGVRLSAHYAQLGYSDTYSKNAYQQKRNLSFNSNIWEVAIQGDFNFFKFMPGDPDHAFTPYITLGVGAFTYDPYAFTDGQKEFLRPLGTEGQLIGYEGRKPYNTLAICIPLGVGIKYNISDKINFSFEVAHRFTSTDYLDDVSTTYIGSGRFNPASTAKLLQDRSVELDPLDPLGIEGRQRGWSKQKDQYIIAEVGITYNLSTYRCPTSK